MSAYSTVQYSARTALHGAGRNRVRRLFHYASFYTPSSFYRILPCLYLIYITVSHCLYLRNRVI